MGSTIKLGETLEEDGLEFLADCLQSYHRGKRIMTSKGVRDRTLPTAGGDLLYDFVRMQVTQLNQLARLGFAHADHGRRMLESFYDAFTSGGACRETVDVEIKASPGAEAKRSLIVENRAFPDGAAIELKASCFRQLEDGTEFNHPVVFEPEKFKLDAGEQKVVEFAVTLDKERFMGGRAYSMTVNIVSSGRVVAQRLVLVRLV